MTKLRGGVALFYTEKAGLLEEVSQYVQRDLSSLSRQRIALEAQTRVNPRLAEELLLSRQFLNTNIQACPISEKKLTLPSVLFNQTGFDRSGIYFWNFQTSSNKGE